ncbi:hypothetical protein ACVWY9_002036 [Thermostichus sp. OS-CIW-31]
MPVHRTGFRLVPWGFFDRNPTINLAEPARYSTGIWFKFNFQYNFQYRGSGLSQALFDCHLGRFPGLTPLSHGFGQQPGHFWSRKLRRGHFTAAQHFPHLGT